MDDIGETGRQNNSGSEARETTPDASSGGERVASNTAKPSVADPLSGVKVNQKEQARIAAEEASRSANEEKKDILDRIKASERWMIFFTAIVALTTVAQFVQSCNNNRSTADQVDRLICAANGVKTAADSFSDSAASINTGISNAVGKLQLQAAATQESANAAGKSAETARQTLYSQRAYIDTAAEMDYASSKIKIAFLNGGHIPSGPVDNINHVIVGHRDTTVGNPPIHFTDAYWSTGHMDSVSTTGHASMRVLLPGMNEADMKNGLQLFVVAGTLTYNDGFPDTPLRKVNFCWTLDYNIPDKVLTAPIHCDYDQWIGFILKADEYPNKKHYMANQVNRSVTAKPTVDPISV